LKANVERLFTVGKLSESWYRAVLTANSIRIFWWVVTERLGCGAATLVSTTAQCVQK